MDDLTKNVLEFMGWEINAEPRLLLHIPPAPLSDFTGIRKRQYIDFNNFSFDLACPHPSPIHTPVFDLCKVFTPHNYCNYL